MNRGIEPKIEPHTSVEVYSNSKKSFSFFQLLAYILIVLLLFCFVAKNRQLTRQVESLTDQIEQIQQQNSTLSDNFEDLSADYDELSNSIKNIDVLTSILTKSMDNVGSSIINISDCITEIYHHTGLHKSNKIPCTECMNMVLGQ